MSMYLCSVYACGEGGRSRAYDSLLACTSCKFLVLFIHKNMRSGFTCISHGKGEDHVVHAGVNCVCKVCGSAHSCGCVVNGTFARAAFYYSLKSYPRMYAHTQGLGKLTECI